MSRRTAIVEDFDDDTDLPLPSRPLRNTGTKGPLLQEIDSDEDDDLETGNEPTAGPATTPQFQPKSPPRGQRETQAPSIDELYPGHKSWTCLYPIYIDAKRPYGTGSRRISREKSVWWPLSQDIADATHRLQLNTIHEANKMHPKDWDNPGRVRVEWKRNGKLMNPAIKSKKQLLETISFQIQRLKPDNIPKPPFNTTPPHTNIAPTPTSKSAKAKTKTPTPASALKTKIQGRRRLPVPPTPHPPLANRVSSYSPALVSGVLIDAVKAGMNATEAGGAGGPAGPGAGPGSPGGAGMGKGKRKVVRVRG